MNMAAIADSAIDTEHLECAAKFAASLKRHDLPQVVVDRVKLMLLDNMGVMIAGSAEERVERMTAALRKRGSTGTSFTVGDRGSCDAADAAAVNATAGCSHVLEEGHKYARGHVGNNVIPAVLAVAEEQKASGSDLITAIVAGYEIAARMGLACRIRPSMHSSGTWHTIGATAGVARAMNLSAAQTRETMNIASALTLATSWNAAEEGATVRDLFAGIGGANAVWAPRWILSGFTGAHGDIAHVFSRVSAEKFDSTELSSGLGERWEVLRNYFKIHACCRNFQSAIDAALELKAQHAFEVREVVRVQVATFDIPVRTNAHTDPQNALSAKESLPITLALTLIHGHCGQSIFDEKNLRSSETARLVSCINITCDPKLDALFPEKRPSRVSIELQDGRQIESYFPVAVGDPALPLSPADLEAKFYRLTTPILGQAAYDLRAAIDNVDRLPLASALSAAIRKM